VSENDTPTVQETGAKPELDAEAQAKQDFIAARKRRNVMIAWSLVAFMVLVFSITALRLTQNLNDRMEAEAQEEMSDETLVPEQE